MGTAVFSFVKFTDRRQSKYLKALEEGHTKGAAAKIVDCSDLLIREYGKLHPEFKEKEDEACESACDKVEKALYDTACKGNVTAIQVWLYNRRPDRWRDKRSITITGLEDVLRLLPAGLAAKLRGELAKLVSGSGGDEGKLGNGKSYVGGASKV